MKNKYKDYGFVDAYSIYKIMKGLDTDMTDAYEIVILSRCGKEW